MREHEVEIEAREEEGRGGSGGGTKILNFFNFSPLFQYCVSSNFFSFFFVSKIVTIQQQREARDFGVQKFVVCFRKRESKEEERAPLFSPPSS